MQTSCFAVIFNYICLPIFVLPGEEPRNYELRAVILYSACCHHCDVMTMSWRTVTVLSAILNVYDFPTCATHVNHNDNVVYSSARLSYDADGLSLCAMCSVRLHDYCKPSRYNISSMSINYVTLFFYVLATHPKMLAHTPPTKLRSLLES